MRSGNKLLTAALAACLSLPALHAQEKEFTLSVTVAAPRPDAKMYLLWRKGSNPKNVDSAEYKNGRYQFAGKTPQTQRAFLCYPAAGKTIENTPMKEAFPVYLESGHIEIAADVTLKGAKLSGTRLNNDLQAYNAMVDSFKQVENALSERYGKANRAKDQDSLRVLTAAFYQLDDDRAAGGLAFLQHHTDSYVSLEWLKGAYNIPRNKSKVIVLFKQLSSNVRSSASGRAFDSLLQAAQSVEIGSLAPLFNAKDTAGASVTLNTFHGKYVLLDFWASWCGPCRRENPNVLKAYERFKSNGFTVVGFSLDDSKPSWKAAIVKDAMPWSQWSEEDEARKKIVDLYGITGIPSNFLIDPDGKIVAQDLRGEDLLNTLNKYL